jgi:predicted RNA-binding protein
MCQATVYVVTDDGKEEIMRQVTHLVSMEDAVQLETFFEEPRTVPGRVAEIDFLRHTVMLTPVTVREERSS